MFFIFLGILLCGAMREIAIQGKKDAFLYNGPAIGMVTDSEQAVIDEKTIQQIENMEHVLGISEWREMLAQPLNAENVKEHTGIDPENQGSANTKADKIVFLEDLCVELNSRFRCEDHVSLTAGEYPSYDNKGILIESRLAEKNGLSIGDSITFLIEETDTVCDYKICGIYRVDSPFVITSDNEEGADVYIHSPYNTIFIDRRYAYETMRESGEAYGIYGGCQIYVDAYENIEPVARQLGTLLGEEYVFYNLAEHFMKSSGSGAALMEQYAKILQVVFLAAGSLVLLILYSLYAKQFEREIGILLALGRKKRSILADYASIIGCIVLCALAGSSLLYLLLSGPVLSGIKEMIEETVFRANIGGGTLTPYETPGLGNGFRMHILKKDLYQPAYFLAAGKTAVLLAGVSLMIPLYRMTRIRAKQILDQNT